MSLLRVQCSNLEPILLCEVVESSILDFLLERKEWASNSVVGLTVGDIT